MLFDISQESFIALKNLLEEEGKKIAIITHRNPDGDAMGSACGLKLFLNKLGHLASIIVPNNYPEFLAWIPGANDALVYTSQKTEATKALSEAEIIFALDFNELKRVREFEATVKASDAFKAMIDHHPNPADFADYALSITSLSSTSELVFHFIEMLGKKHIVDKDIATGLYVGLMTDTGNFSFNSSRQETFYTASSLLEHGIEKDEIYNRVYNFYSFDRMRLMGYCLNKKMQYFPEYRTALISLTQEEMEQFNFVQGDTEGFVNLPLSIKGVRFSGLFLERGNLVKVSLRSKGSFAVNEICSKYFNGGGHVNAAGGESSKSLDEVIKEFIELLPNYKKALHDE